MNTEVQSPLDEWMDLDEARKEAGGAERPISRSAFYAGIRSGFFPKPVKITARLSRWRRGSIRAAQLARAERGV